MALFHIGVLYSKILNGLGRFKKWTKFFNFQFSVIFLTKRMRKSCTQLDFVCLGGQYYGLGQSTTDQPYGGLSKEIFCIFADCRTWKDCIFKISTWIWSKKTDIYSYRQLTLIRPSFFAFKRPRGGGGIKTQLFLQHYHAIFHSNHTYMSQMKV